MSERPSSNPQAIKSRRLLHLIGSGEAGGREKQLYLMLQEQATRNRHEVGVLFQNGTGHFFELIKTLPAIKVSILPAGGELSPRSLLIAWQLIRHADLVILHSPRLAFLLPLLFCRTPLICRVSGLRVLPIRLFRRKKKADATKGAFAPAGNVHIGKSTCARQPGSWQTWFTRVQRLLRWWLYRHALRSRAQIVLTISQQLAQQIAATYGVDSSKIRVLYIGLSTKNEEALLQQVDSDGRGNGLFKVCFVGRLDPRKRLDRLFAAAVPLHKQGVAFQLDIVGTGPMDEPWKKQVMELGLQDNVEFFGHTDNPFQRLTKADLFVLPSDNEAFSNAVLEAMYAGVPVVVFAGQCGASEIIKDEDNGFLVSSVEELQQLLLRLASDRSLCTRVGHKGREMLLHNGMTMHQHVDALEKIIDEVLG